MAAISFQASEKEGVVGRRSGPGTPKPANPQARMPQLTGGDIMVREVVTIDAYQTVRAAAQVLLDNRISGLPVIDGNGYLVGIVTEGDLIRRAEIGTNKRRSWWLELFTSPEARAIDFVRSHAVHVADLMTRRVVTAAEDTPLRQIANLMERHGVKRVPILRDGKLVGIVSRANLLRAFAKAVAEGEDASLDDGAIRARVLEAIEDVPGAGMPWMVDVTVAEGVVGLRGPVDTQEPEHPREASPDRIEQGAGRSAG